MSKHIIAFMFIFCFLFAVVSFSQDDRGYSVVQANDGGYIFLGTSNSYTYGSYDMLVYKLDSLGNKVWRKHYGGTLDDRGYYIQRTSDNGYLICGMSLSYKIGNADFLLYKLDSNGNKLWRRNFGGTNNDYASSCGETADGDIFIFGTSASYTRGSYDFLIYKLNSSGNKVWRKHYGGTADDSGAAAVNLPYDKAYLLFGDSYSYSYGGEDFLAYRLDFDGDKTWRKHYGGAADDTTRYYRTSGSAVIQTLDGGFVFCGSSTSYTHGDWDILVYKIDSVGNKVWRKNYGGTQTDGGKAIQQTSDGGYVLAGNSYSYTHGGSDLIVYRLDSAENKVWRKHYGGNSSDAAYCIKQTTDGGFVVSGETLSYTYSPGNYDFLLYKLDSDGNKEWRKHYGK